MKIEFSVTHHLKPYSNKINEPLLTQKAPEIKHSGLIKYSELTKLAFSGTLMQLKPSSNNEDFLESTKVSPLPGLKHSKEFPLPLKNLKEIMEKFELAKNFVGINNDTKPTMSVYNLSSNGKIYGVYDFLVNRLTICEGTVLFDMNGNFNLADEALAHENYHCSRAQLFSKLSDAAITKAIDKRLYEILKTQEFPLYKLMSGGYPPELPEEAIQIMLDESVKPLDTEPKDSVINRLSELIPDYPVKELPFYLKVVKRARKNYEKNIVIGYEPALKENLFSLKTLANRLPDNIIKRTQQSNGGITREEAIKRIAQQKVNQIILMGYISHEEANNARAIRQKILETSKVKEGSPEEALLLKDIENIFEIDDAACNLNLANVNRKDKDINRFKIQEEYMYSNEEINARQTGLKYRINHIKTKLDSEKDEKSYKYRMIMKDLNTAQADFDLNNTMLQLKTLRKQAELNSTPALNEKIQTLTEKVTKLAEIAEHTVPKILKRDRIPYIPFSYGNSYRTVPEEHQKQLDKYK